MTPQFKICFLEDSTTISQNIIKNMMIMIILIITIITIMMIITINIV